MSDFSYPDFRSLVNAFRIFKSSQSHGAEEEDSSRNRLGWPPGNLTNSILLKVTAVINVNAINKLVQH